MSQIYTPAPLSARQHEVLVRVARGHSNARMSRDLFVSVATIERTVEEMRRKLGASNRAHAVHIGHREGLLK